MAIPGQADGPFTKLCAKVRRKVHDRRVSSRRHPHHVSPAHRVVKSVRMIGCIHGGGTEMLPLRYRQGHLDQWQKCDNIPHLCEANFMNDVRTPVTPMQLKSERAFLTFNEVEVQFFGALPTTTPIPIPAVVELSTGGDEEEGSDGYSESPTKRVRWKEREDLNLPDMLDNTPPEGNLFFLID